MGRQYHPRLYIHAHCGYFAMRTRMGGWFCEECWQYIDEKQLITLRDLCGFERCNETLSQILDRAHEIQDEEKLNFVDAFKKAQEESVAEWRKTQHHKTMEQLERKLKEKKQT